MTPSLAELPVYVRPGTILPYAPLIPSTQEQPRGPLTVRVYPGPDCHGSLYADDGHSFAYQKGDSLRVTFSCETAVDGAFRLHLGAHQAAILPGGRSCASRSTA